MIRSPAAMASRMPLSGYSDRLAEDHRVDLAGQEHPRVAARDHQRVPEVLLHQRPSTKPSIIGAGSKPNLVKPTRRRRRTR